MWDALSHFLKTPTYNIFTWLHWEQYTDFLENTITFAEENQKMQKRRSVICRWDNAAVYCLENARWSSSTDGKLMENRWGTTSNVTIVDNSKMQRKLNLAKSIPDSICSTKNRIFKVIERKQAYAINITIFTFLVIM